MSNRLLKKILLDISSCPEDQLKTLVGQTLEEEDMMRNLLDNLPEGHVLVNEQGIVVLMNNTVYKLIPFRRKFPNAEGRPLADTIPDHDISSFVVGVVEGKEPGDPRDFSLQIGGEVRTLRVSFRSIATDNRAYLDIIFSDITDDIRSQTRLRRSESLASMTTMAAGVAHEIKNPLAAMTIHLQLMRKAFQKFGTMDEEKAERYLSVIEEETEHLNKIAVDFLFAVRPMEVELKLNSINELVEDVLSFLQPEADDKKIEVTFNKGAFIPRIELDGRLVKQAVLNIIQNAFGAMQEGGKLTVQTKVEGDILSLSIADTGCGIPEEKISRIFEPYYTTKAQGTGLGLTLVYKIMKEHKGDIQVRSEVGDGTTFTLYFPVPVSERKALEEK